MARCDHTWMNGVCKLFGYTHHHLCASTIPFYSSGSKGTNEVPLLSGYSGCATTLAPVTWAPGAALDHWHARSPLLYRPTGILLRIRKHQPENEMQYLHSRYSGSVEFFVSVVVSAIGNQVSNTKSTAPMGIWPTNHPKFNQIMMRH